MFRALKHQVNVLESVATSSFSAWRGCLVVKAVPQPEKPLILFDIEACPFCRKVREALTALHLDTEIRPCPKGGRIFRAEAEAIGGKKQFPLLVDQNTGETLYESDAIVEYLFRQYANRPVPGYYKGKSWQTALGAAGSAASELRGMRPRRCICGVLRAVLSPVWFASVCANSKFPTLCITWAKSIGPKSARPFSASSPAPMSPRQAASVMRSFRRTVGYRCRTWKTPTPARCCLNLPVSWPTWKKNTPCDAQAAPGMAIVPGAGIIGAGNLTADSGRVRCIRASVCVARSSLNTMARLAPSRCAIAASVAEPTAVPSRPVLRFRRCVFTLPGARTR